MKITTKLFMTAGVVAGLSFAGDVKGKVNFGGAAPKREAIKMNADPKCLKAAAGKQVLNDAVIVNGNKTLANTFVYVKEGVKNAPPADATPVTFDQRGCMYAPHMVGVRVNQPFIIVNDDDTMHNVHSLSKSNPGFNSAMPMKGQQIKKTFAKPETMIRVKCDVHTWMNGYINVMDHPYFAVSDDQGNFAIKNLPAGEYTLEAVHSKFGAKTAKVTVTDAGGTADFAF